MLTVITITSLYALIAADGSAKVAWDTSDTSHPGQLTLYNPREFGGSCGLPVELGDFNGDGHMDLVIAPRTLNTGNKAGRKMAGEVYVLSGDGRISGTVDLEKFDKTTFPGLTVRGARAGDLLGTKVASGDVNGDGIADLLLSAMHYDGPRKERKTGGGVFVILGKKNLLADGSILDLAYDPDSPPPLTVTIIGERPGDRLGVWVTSGDIDGDGIDDILMGGDLSAGLIQTEERFHVGMAAVLYDRDNYPALIDLEDGPEKISGRALIYGRDHLDHFGSTLHARDLGGDEQAELIIAAAMNRILANQPDEDGGGGAGNPIFLGRGGGDGPDEQRFDAGELTIIFSSINGSGRLPERIDLAAEIPAGLSARMGIVYGAIAGSTTGEEIDSGDIDGVGRLDFDYKDF